MTFLSRFSILLLFGLALSSCCLFCPPDEIIQTPDKLGYEGEKQVEYSVNHLITVLMTSSPLIYESDAQVTYLGFKDNTQFSRRVDSVFESKLHAVDALHFSLYNLKASKSWTLVAKKLKKLKERYVAYIYLLDSEGTPVWKWKMEVKYTETADDAWRVQAGIPFTDKEQEEFENYIIDFVNKPEFSKENPVAIK